LIDGRKKGIEIKDWQSNNVFEMYLLTVVKRRSITCAHEYVDKRWKGVKFMEQLSEVRPVRPWTPAIHFRKFLKMDGNERSRLRVLLEIP
jgi:hypothetical protein